MKWQVLIEPIFIEAPDEDDARYAAWDRIRNGAYTVVITKVEESTEQADGS